MIYDNYANKSQVKDQVIATVNAEVNAEVISFLSSKGGAGKTSVAIGVSYLLNDAGLKVLLIDFDFATNGASYFYNYLYPSESNIAGIYELMNEQNFKLDGISFDFNTILFKIKEGLSFIPSRVNFSKKLPLRDSVVVYERSLESFLLRLIKLHKKDYHFIMIDNQAGSNVTSKVSAKVSDKVMIVSEFDPISRDAADTLLIQIGDAFPEYHRHLINKLNINEIEEYKKYESIFQEMNILPPLPFDFEVRRAISSRHIPIDVKKPTTFLMALFNTVKTFISEYRDQIGKYGEKISEKFDELQDRVESLTEKKLELTWEMEVLRKKGEKKGLRVITLTSIIGIFLGVTLFIVGFIFDISIFLRSQILITAAGAIVVAVSAVYFIIGRFQHKERKEDALRKEKINADMSDIKKEIEGYESLMLTRTQDFVDYFKKLQ